MMDKQLVAIALAVTALFGAAHLLRYEPLASVSPLGMQPVWDRWFHRVCVVFFSQDNRIVCSFESLTAPEKQSSNVSLEDQIKQLHAAGFSEQEIIEYVQKTLKAESK